MKGASFSLLTKNIFRTFFSWFNKTEVNRVMFYLDEILNTGINGRKIHQSDIGIISPYKKQVSHCYFVRHIVDIKIFLFKPMKCSIIEDACRRKGWRNILISSVELLQGKEKPIIIVSTVRSQSKSIGFLDNFRVKNF